MAAFTTIALAVVAVGGAVTKGVLAGDAASSAAREAGNLRLQQEELEKEAVARLEQDFFEGVRANTDIYDKALEVSNVKGAELVQAAQEGDQRGIAATAGKVKAIEQAGLSALSDQFSKEKLEIDLNRAKANEMSAAEIAAMQDDRAAAAGLRSDALMAQSDTLRGEATANFIQAGQSALTYGVDIATEISAGKDQAAIDKLVAGGKTLGEAQTIVADASKGARRDYMGGNANAFGAGSKTTGASQFDSFKTPNIKINPQPELIPQGQSVSNQSRNPFLGRGGQDMFAGIFAATEDYSNFNQMMGFSDPLNFNN
tara:strand:+ start:3319 stop:4260 length:942 start_codon:yes stop_codon:yes gene_type:complete